ncbi:hypothetical protein [Roseomonas chloroacetimidivorans]|uniref:hypothetical protein n=1 Tax=Roseomonas chloroacetimidivorans TaxID=1766656 RepID=UPI003C7641CB
MLSPAILTSFVNPPVSVRCFDWSATLHGYGGEPSEPIGRGVTEAAAVRDLLDQIEEEEPAFADAQPCTLRLSTEAMRWLDADLEAAVAGLLRDEAAARGEGDAGAIRQAAADTRLGGMVLAALRSASR